MEARGADERERTIYDLLSRDCLTGEGGTCVLALPPQCRPVFDRWRASLTCRSDRQKMENCDECSEQQPISIPPLTGCRAGGCN